MNSIPKVSVIVPIYNVEKYLDRCITSIVNQTLQDIEIILIDDESTDSCPTICDKWEKKDSRIKVIHKTNGGLGHARNSGIEVASGQYVSFIDSDDFIEREMLQKLYDACIAEMLDCIYSEFNVNDYPGFTIVPQPERLYVGASEIEELRLDIVGAEPSYISGVKYHCSSCKGLYSLNLIKRKKIRFLSEREFISEDMLFNLDFLYHAKRVKIVPWQFYHYCLNNASLTHTYRPDRWEKLLLMLMTLNDEERYHNKQELKLRLKRTAIFYTMSAVLQERRRKDISFFDKMKAIRIIEKEPIIVEAVKDYPITKLPFKWKVYAFLLKRKLLEFVFVV